MGAHPKKEEVEIIKILKEFGFLEDYQLKNWKKLHQSILELYINFLKNLLTLVNKKKLK